jgi:hypothetical protein
MDEIKKGLEKIRAFVDLDITGNANGNIFIHSDLKDKVEELEESGELRVVGVVYDGTYNLEILTQPKGKKPNIGLKQKK